jgi:hypothetical protein
MLTILASVSVICIITVFINGLPGAGGKLEAKDTRIRKAGYATRLRMKSVIRAQGF